MTPPTLIAKYKKLDNSYRYTLCYGGRGSAKSFHVAIYLLMLTYKPGEVILFTRYTMTSAQMSIIPEFREKIAMYGMEAAFDVSGATITNRVTGSKIIFSGIKTSSGNQTAKLKSIAGLTCWVLDEAEEMVNPKDFEKIDDSIRTKGGSNRVILVFNPTDVEHWLYKSFFESGQRKDTTYIHTSYLDNLDNLDNSFVRKAERVKKEDPVHYRHNYLGEFSAIIDSIFPRGYTVYDDEEEGGTMCLGGDFGFSDHPTAVVKVRLDKNNLYLREVVYEEGLTNREISEAIPEQLRREICVFDSAEKKSIVELRRLNINAYPAKKGPDSVTYSIRAIQGLNVYIHKDSVNLQSEWTKYRWAKMANGEYVRDSKGNKKPVKVHDDAIDATRYAVMFLTKWEL